MNKYVILVFFQPLFVVFQIFWLHLLKIKIKARSNLIKLDQIWSNLINIDQVWSNLMKTLIVIKIDQVWSISDLLQTRFNETKIIWHNF